MLAQSFMTAADLGLTDEQHSALIKTLALMDGGKLVHDRVARVVGPADEPKVGLFNMDIWVAKTDCGTVCCIGGTAEAVAGERIFTHSDFTAGLDDLFFPCQFGRRNTTVPQAAIALRSYLTTGDARWDLALADQHSGALADTSRRAEA